MMHLSWPCLMKVQRQRSNKYQFIQSSNLISAAVTMKHTNFESKTSFAQGSYASAQAHGSGNSKSHEVTTEIGVQDDVVFQVSPDGTVRIICPSTTYSYSSSRSSGL
jgi:hypothetical protein